MRQSSELMDLPKSCCQTLGMAECHINIVRTPLKRTLATTRSSLGRLRHPILRALWRELYWIK
ncbi:hypothetical protein B0I35DRAFT_427644 [Stachybotrys elegans]|uniref:Uncharacterized protein n=1 Tax=Stachybotrys elegans TaxID=80388 RepID=A0A8K0SV35_9HYPO|nr:hypothetical protein B0I35DRAFT_427644 [Stachybotrys elegans]